LQEREINRGTLLFLFTCAALFATSSVLLNLTRHCVQRLEDTFAEISEILGFGFTDSDEVVRSVIPVLVNAT
jgi:hypothetical protein